MTISAYSTTASSNVSINGVPVSEGMPRSYVSDAIRNLMADIKTWTDANGATVPFAINKGGTGQTTANAAFNALAASGGTVTGTLKQASKGSYPYWSATAMTGGQMFLQALGSDPTSNPGDIVYEY